MDNSFEKSSKFDSINENSGIAEIASTQNGKFSNFLIFLGYLLAVASSIVLTYYLNHVIIACYIIFYGVENAESYTELCGLFGKFCILHTLAAIAQCGFIIWLIYYFANRYGVKNN